MEGHCYLIKSTLSVYQLCLFYPPFLVHEKDLRNCGEILCTVECHG